jgi:hypothetical protein
VGRLGTLLDRWVTGARQQTEPRRRFDVDPVTVLSLAVLIPAALATALRIAVNAPITLPQGIPGLTPTAETAVLLLGGVGAVVVGLRSTATVERVGLVAVGVFAGLATVTPSATVPTTGVLVVGTAVLVGHRLTWADIEDGRAVVAIGFLLALAASIGSTTGLLTPGFRAVGAWLALLSLAALSIIARPGWPGWLVGGLAVAGVLYAGIASPFLTGAVVLIGAGVVGTPLLLVAAGIGGVVAAITGSILEGSYPLAVGGLLLLMAGVPATVPAGVTVVIGLVLLLHRPTGVAA